MTDSVSFCDLSVHSGQGYLELKQGYLARKNFHRKQGEVGFLPVVAIATKANWSFTLVGTYIFHERGHSETISKRDIGHSADSPGLETEV